VSADRRFARLDGSNRNDHSSEKSQDCQRIERIERILFHSRPLHPLHPLDPLMAFGLSSLESTITRQYPTRKREAPNVRDSELLQSDEIAATRRELLTDSRTVGKDLEHNG
jgi:hypothetical protein